MPTYEFRCQKCEKIFQLTYSFAELERAKKEGIRCSSCGSSQVKQQIAPFMVQTSKKS